MINSSLMVILFIGLPVSSQNGETFMYKAAFVRYLRSGCWVFHFSIVPIGIKFIFQTHILVMAPDHKILILCRMVWMAFLSFPVAVFFLPAFLFVPVSVMLVPL